VSRCNTASLGNDDDDDDFVDGEVRLVTTLGRARRGRQCAALHEREKRECNNMRAGRKS